MVALVTGRGRRRGGAGDDGKEERVYWIRQRTRDACLPSFFISFYFGFLFFTRICLFKIFLIKNSLKF